MTTTTDSTTTTAEQGRSALQRYGTGDCERCASEGALYGHPTSLDVVCRECLPLDVRFDRIPVERLGDRVGLWLIRGDREGCDPDPECGAWLISAHDTEDEALAAGRRVLRTEPGAWLQYAREDEDGHDVE